MSSRPDSFMPLWIADYLADTQHLTCEQHGAYLLLLFAYWRRQGPLPDDGARLAAIAKVSPQKWRTLRLVLAEFFTIEAGAWKNKRADQEIAKAAVLHAKKVAAGKKGAEIRYSTTSSAIAEGVANEQQPHSISHLTSHLDSSENQRPVEPLLVREDEREPPPRAASKPISSKRERGARWELDAVPEDWIAAAIAAYPAVDVRHEAVAFVNHWHGAPGAKGVKLNWHATWTGWILREAKRLRERNNGRANGTGQHGPVNEVAAVFFERYNAARAKREDARQ